jgi:hypothetical protein
MKTKGNKAIFRAVKHGRLYNQRSAIGHLFIQNCLKHEVSDGNCIPEHEHLSVLIFFGNESNGK